TMKPLSINPLKLILPLLVMGINSTLSAESHSGAKDPDKPTMLVVVADSLVSHRAYHDDLDMYIRIKANFGKVFEKQGWPMNFDFERWSASVPDGGLQLRIWFKSLEEETIGDLVFRAWVTLLDDGQKTDFKIIKVRTYPRPGRAVYENIDEILSLAAEEVAKKLDEHLFDKS
ncbi:MAG: hypothetical protein KJT03_18705, partial [Verrucomicrobiae bacterium]|nr:hypothetical protein [Verrucomicrobiae bacterium]